MLACNVKDVSKLEFPLVVSPKLDGIRATIQNGQVISRSGKLIPNEFIQRSLGHGKLNGLDGELIVGDVCAEDVYRTTNSAVMSKEGNPDFLFYVFDDINVGDRYLFRRAYMLDKIGSDETFRVVPCAQDYAKDAEELLKLEERYTELGYEGLIARDPDSYYKHGRSTLKQGALLKIKRFEDAEAVIIGTEPLYKNNNEKTKDELGYSQRSSHKENKEAQETLGALIVRDTVSGIEFKIGTGFDADTRKSLWQEGEALFGKIVKYKFFPVGVKEKPRHPVWLGFRDARDIS